MREAALRQLRLQERKHLHGEDSDLRFRQSEDCVRGRDREIAHRDRKSVV